MVSHTPYMVYRGVAKSAEQSRENLRAAGGVAASSTGNPVINMLDSGITGAVNTIGMAANGLQIATLPLMAVPLIGGAMGFAGMIGNKAGMNGSKLIDRGERVSKFAEMDVRTAAGKALGAKNAAAIGEGASTAFHTTASYLRPITDPLGKLPGMAGLKAENMKNFPREVGQSSIMHAAFTTSFLTMQAVSLYGTARDFASQMVALRQLKADLEGKKLEEVTSASVLFDGNAPPAVAAARKTLLATSGAHTLTELASMAVLVKTAAINKKVGPMLGMAAWFIPDLLRQGADLLMGQSPLPHYKGLRDAQARGEEIPPEAIAEFIYASSEQIRHRGATGQSFALELAKDYVAEGARICTILNEISDQKILDERIAAICKRQEAEKQVQAAAPQESSHVDRLSGKGAPARPELGLHTARLNREGPSPTERVH